MIIVRGDDRFHIDFPSSKLWRLQDGRREEKHLTPKAWGVLQYLADRPGVLVPKDDLLNAVWAKVSVTEASLTKVIRELRRAVGDNPDAPAFIETIHGRGFLFIAEIETDPEPPPNSTVDVDLGKLGPGVDRAAAPESMAAKASGELENAVAAWTTVGEAVLYDAVVDYYRRKDVPMLSYPSFDGSAKTVPLFVKDSWLSLEDNSLEMRFYDVDRPAQLSPEKQRFRVAYPEIRRQLGLSGGWSDWNDPVFRLTRVQQRAAALHLRFERGWFLDAHACQYFLEHEARLALFNTQTRALSPDLIPVREASASTADQIERFCAGPDVVRIGISNLILLRMKGGSYQALIRQRGTLSMDPSGKFDAMSSGIFDIATGQPEVADFALEYKVLKEIWEELFRGEEVQRDIRKVDPYFFHKKPGIREIKDMLLERRYAFLRVTGFCIDLVRLVPEITTVLVVNDPSYHAKYGTVMDANAEYAGAVLCEVPCKTSDAERYLREEFPAYPGRPSAGRGFDPTRWTLTGGFCLQQGIKRAVCADLLS